MHQRERQPANGQIGQHSTAYNIPTNQITSISISAHQDRITSREPLADSTASRLLLARCFVQPYATGSADPERWEGWAEYLLFGTLPRKSSYKTAGQSCPFVAYLIGNRRRVRQVVRASVRMFVQSDREKLCRSISVSGRWRYNVNGGLLSGIGRLGRRVSSEI